MALRALLACTDEDDNLSDLPAADVMTDEVRDRRNAWLLVLLALVFAQLVLMATPWGLGITPDSLHYLRAARSFAGGEGLAAFSPQWPPAYPMAIAMVSALPADLMLGARWLNALAAAGSILLLALIGRRCGWRPLATVPLVLLVGLQAGFLHVHYLMWSEPLFLFFCLGNVFFLHAVLANPKRLASWFGMVLCMALAIQVRYAGFFLLLLNAGSLLLLLPRGNLFKRLSMIVAACGLGLLPALAWMAHNRLQGEQAVNRVLAWHSPSGKHLGLLGHTVAVWFRVPETLGLVVFVALLALAFWRAAKAATTASSGSAELHRRLMPSILGMYVIAYTTFLALSIAFVDHHTPLGERILFPLFPLAWLLLLDFFVRLGHRFVRWTSLALLSAVLAFGAFVGWIDLQANREEGQGLTSRRVQTMPVLAWLRQIPADLPIVSNGPDLCTIYLRRDSQMLPRRLDPKSTLPDPSWRGKLDSLTQGPTVVVHFQAMAWRTYLPGPDELEKLSSMRLVYSGPDALVWVRNERPAR